MAGKNGEKSSRKREQTVQRQEVERSSVYYCVLKGDPGQVGKGNQGKMRQEGGVGGSISHCQGLGWEGGAGYRVLGECGGWQNGSVPPSWFWTHDCVRLPEPEELYASTERVNYTVHKLYLNKNIKKQRQKK